MGNYLVLSDVSNSLANLLRRNMVPEPISKPEAIGLCPPHEKSDYQLTIHLYSIIENSDYRPDTMISSGENKLKYPPMSLTLFYLLTAHSNTDLKSRAFDEQRILGKAIQVFNANPILEMPDLAGTLADNNERLEIVMNRFNHDDMMKLWNFPNTPYKLSVSYRVSPVLLESTRIKQVKRVVDSEIILKQRTGGR